MHFKIVKTIATSGFLSPGPRWGSLQLSPDFIAGLRGTLLLKGRGGEERGDGPLTQIPGSASVL